jgi:hypothetical protein
MNTQTQTFTRKAKVEYVPLKLEENKPVYVQVISEKIGKMKLKSQENESNFVMVTDLNSGEIKTMWLSGQLNFQLNKRMADGTLKGAKLEIIKLNTTTPVEVDGDIYQASNFEIYDLQ